MEIKEIDKRYSQLAESECCLSCGGAVNYANAQKGEICIDLGSGRGTDVLRMAEEVGETGFVYGIDISDGMLEKARKNAEKFKVKNVEFLKTNLEKIELPDSFANLIISNCTINHVSDKQAVWNELFRILKNNGRFVISDIYSTETVPEEFKNDETAVAECWAGAVTKDEYLKTVEQAGFKNIEIIEESKPYQKGKIHVSSFTIAGRKITKSCCCCN